ncbi:MAG: hypothetical protein EOO17_03240 [Chloroflexi bacterium]|nr:MAG: hypothetical protein EOO17_03240 [Chloroflexota bacterium]
MIYSQKYSLVHFIEPLEIGVQFHMSEWPLHTTLADVFAIDPQGADFERLLASKFIGYPPVRTAATADSILGTTRVVLLDKTKELLNLHDNVINLLEQNGAVFNTPEFNKEGFIPHSTIQNSERLDIGQKVIIDSLSLIDMFPDGDWQQRKVLFTFCMS